jgi:crossover junction endodeoxyribonuclease RusA
MIELPWPPKELSPNSRTHWRKKASVAKGYRNDCYLLTKAANHPPLETEDGGLVLAIEFVPPDRRQRDDDNCLAAFKSGRDGIADALGINDNRFKTTLWLSDKPVKGGMVRVSITVGGQV